MEDLSRNQQVKLLNLARNTIHEYIKGNRNYNVPEQEFTDSIFNERCGAFVTLHINGSLRGCIGYIEGADTIPNTVRDMAKASAFRDPRFPSLTMREYKYIDIEISILSPIERVRGVSDIIIGKDGLIITCGSKSGLLLPQVATENNWDLTTFLENTCYKAGLAGNAWQRKDAVIEKFSAQVFGEKELGII